MEPPNLSEKPAPVRLEFTASPIHLASVRRLVEQIAARTVLTRIEVDDLLTCVDEAVANAIRHGSPNGEENTIEVRCWETGKSVLVQVRDQGGGFSVPGTAAMPSPDAPGGRGLPLMTALSNRIEIASSRRGTTVTLEKVSAEN